jgi:pSer/pThr/pTyr-binding forkhead associated (FHA) protein/tetratricopeptide (TPR) repeat protein
MTRLLVFYNGEKFTTLELESGRDYFAGRNDDSDIVLRNLTGVSRRHFKVSEESGIWNVQALSKFAELSYLGSRVTAIELNAPLTFSVGPYEFHVELGDMTTSDHGAHAHLPAKISHFAGTAEATQAGTMQVSPYVRIIEGRPPSEKQIQLVGNAWTGGRDKNCEIIIGDNHASRRQFAITLNDQGYFITDLGSANGTLLNQAALAPNRPTPLRSGDVISVLSTEIHFEVRSSDFEQQVANVAHQAAIVGPEENSLIVRANYDSAFANLPPPTGFEFPSNYDPYLPQLPPAEASFWQKNRLRVIIGILALFGVVGALMPNAPKEKKASTQKEDPFARLTPEQQTLIKDQYNLARNLIEHRKWEMALAELQKIHQVVPSYLDSKGLETEVQRSNELRQEEMALEKEQQRQAEMKRQVGQIVEGCRSKMTPSILPEAVHDCLGQALDLDPENAGAKDLIARAEQNLQERQRRAAQHQGYLKNVHSLEALCARADSLFHKGELYDAKRAYQRCVSSGLPDPKGLKFSARRTLASVGGTMTKQFKEHMDEAEQAYKKGDFKVAYANLQKAKQADPDNPGYSGLFQKVDRDATNKMKLIYSDSVLEESLGQIESAKEKWQKIIDLGITDSEYFRRAKRKLQRYGVM